MARLFTSFSFFKPGRTAAAGALLFALSASALVFSADRALARLTPYASAKLSRDLGVRTEIGRLGMDLPAGVVAHDVRIGGGVHAALPDAIRIDRVRMRPSFALLPEPTLHWHVTFESPALTVRSELSQVLLMGQLVRRAPLVSKRFGPLRVNIRLGSLRMKRGRVTLASPSDERPWRQEFENVRAFTGKRWFAGDRVEISGHAPGDASADFTIRGRVKNERAELMDGEIRFDCRRFATAYLRPHLDERVRLPEGSLTASIRLKVKRGAFSSKGRFSIPKISGGRHPLLRALTFAAPSVRYEVKGEAEADVWRVTKIVVESSGVRLRGQGEIDWAGEGSLDVSLSSGAVPLRNFSALVPEIVAESGDIRLHATVTGPLSAVKPSLDVVFAGCALRDAAGRVRLSKLDGRLRLSPQDWTLDETWLFANDLPLGARGFWRGGAEPRGKLELFTYPGQIPSLRPKNPLNAELTLSAEKNAGAWNASVDFKRVKYAAGRAEEYRAHFAAERVTPPPPLELLRADGARLSCGTLEIFREARGPRGEITLSVPRIRLSDAHFVLRADADRARLELERGVYLGGRLSGKADASTAGWPRFGWTADAVLEDADAAQAARQLRWPEGVEGRLGASGHWTGRGSSSEFAGRVVLREVAFPSSASFERLADQTGAEPLRRPRFSRASADIRLKDGVLELENALCEGEDCIVAARLKFRPGGRVGGRLSLRLKDTAVRASSGLKWLSRFVGAKGWIDFDFKVAGTLASPRVEWLPGEFKSKLESRIAPWLRGMFAAEIERRIEAGG